MADKGVTPQTDEFDYRLQTPFSYSIFGASQSGKSQFIRNFLDVADAIIDERVGSIHYFYQTWQNEFDSVMRKHPKITFVQGVLTMSWLEKVIGLPSEREEKGAHVAVPLIIVDDAGAQIDADTQQVFEIGVHHFRFNLLYTFHALFSSKREHRSISLSSSYLHIKRNIRDQTPAAILSRQMEGAAKSVRFMDIFNDATRLPYSYLLVDLKQSCPYSRQLRANILFEREQPMVVYERQN